jgi:2-amino-4-hydroxy-6-hydroxymethyldihydropteridine diphosphokinase
VKNEVYVALGSNIEDRENHLKRAVIELDRESEIKVANLSSIYETDPVGYEKQEAFLNMVIKIETSLSPLELIGITQRIEVESGRKRDVRWGPRTLDLDILLYNQENIETEQLIVPHPRMDERAFVMIPLLEINPKIKLPASNSDGELRISKNQFIDKEGVRLWKRRSGEGEYGLFES